MSMRFIIDYNNLWGTRCVQYYNKCKNVQMLLLVRINNIINVKMCVVTKYKYVPVGHKIN
jgi:hypothetical protein